MLHSKRTISGGFLWEAVGIGNHKIELKDPGWWLWVVLSLGPCEAVISKTWERKVCSVGYSEIISGLQSKGSSTQCREDCRQGVTPQCQSPLPAPCSPARTSGHEGLLRYTTQAGLLEKTVGWTVDPEEQTEDIQKTLVLNTLRWLKFANCLKCHLFYSWLFFFFLNLQIQHVVFELVYVMVNFMC